MSALASHGSVDVAVPGSGPLRQIRRLRRFLRSPKGYLLVALCGLIAVAAPYEGMRAVAVTLCAAVAGAVGMDLILMRLSDRPRFFPSSALLTGLIVGMVLSAQESPAIAFCAGVLAIDAKYLLRLGRTHVFNPAAVGLLGVYALFGSGQSWWGALADLPGPLLLLLCVAGYLVAGRANKLPAALTFAGLYGALFTFASFAGTPTLVADIFRPPFLNAAAFFALFMVTDPPTSPVTFAEQGWFGALVAAVAYIVYMTTHGLYYLLVAILVANVAWAATREGARWLTRTHIAG
jgi:Na+-translocating ferredoxin:NAD+ oxidoreductase RnfD subunit